jgi:hypothetical protein
LGEPVEYEPNNHGKGYEEQTVEKQKYGSLRIIAGQKIVLV